MSRPNRLPFSFAVIGALALALSLAACGRKGALDPPPGGYQLDPSVTRTPVTRRGESAPKEKPQDFDEDGRPIAPDGPKKKLPIDWLIN